MVGSWVHRAAGQQQRGGDDSSGKTNQFSKRLHDSETDNIRGGGGGGSQLTHLFTTPLIPCTYPLPTANLQRASFLPGQWSLGVSVHVHPPGSPEPVPPHAIGRPLPPRRWTSSWGPSRPSSRSTADSAASTRPGGAPRGGGGEREGGGNSLGKIALHFHIFLPKERFRGASPRITTLFIFLPQKLQELEGGGDPDPPPKPHLCLPS